MNTPYIPKLSLGGAESPFSLRGHVSAGPSIEGPSFKNVMANTIGEVNKVASAPDTLMQQSMTTGNVDVHEVMIANAKAELAVNLTAQFTTKVVQAYDRILQIQI